MSKYGPPLVRYMQNTVGYKSFYSISVNALPAFWIQFRTDSWLSRLTGKYKQTNDHLSIQLQRCKNVKNLVAFVAPNELQDNLSINLCGYPLKKGRGYDNNSKTTLTLSQGWQTLCTIFSLEIKSMENNEFKAGKL